MTAAARGRVLDVTRLVLRAGRPTLTGIDRVELAYLREFLARPEPLRQWGWAVGVLAFAIVAEGISMRACLQEVNKSRGGRSLWRWFRDSRQAELVVIFGEDLAALLGLLFALLAVVLSVITGNPLWDAIGTMAIGALLIVIAVLVAIEIKAMLIGQSVDPVLEQRLLDYLKARAEIEKLIHVITLQQGNEVVVSVQAVMRQREDVHALLLDINRVEDELKADFPVVRWTFFEPDLPRAQQVGRQGAPAA